MLHILDSLTGIIFLDVTVSVLNKSLSTQSINISFAFLSSYKSKSLNSCILSNSFSNTESINNNLVYFSIFLTRLNSSGLVFSTAHSLCILERL